MSSITQHSYSHTHHFVTVEQFEGYVEGLLSNDKITPEQKAYLQDLQEQAVWQELKHKGFFVFGPTLSRIY